MYQSLRISSFFLLGLFSLLALNAFATSKDHRVWSEGTPAASAAQVLSPPSEATEIRLPQDLRQSLTLPTVLLYFSPGCPHCQAVAPELSELEESIAGKAEILFIASAATTEAELQEFLKRYAISSRAIIDQDRQIGASMGISSTPSALLVANEGDKTFVQAVWYPYFAGYDTLLKMRLNPSDPWAAFGPGDYHGSRTCGACHQQEIEAWSLSHHSIAWRTLEKSNADKRPECVGCHVTGHEKAKGWKPTDSHHLVDVGCEACHGPGGPHDGERHDASKVCDACHDAKHSIAFSLEKGLPLIDHFLTAQMTDEDYVSRRKALYKGEAPRNLLAFQEGTMVGSKICKDCHSDEYSHWKRSPHAKAMNTLPAKLEVECIQCHATSKASGPPSTTINDYILEESVGCESCHGPGDKHVKAGGGTENIEKLGDDCPVCVIEAVCTRCHTTQWDPSWDLSTDLPKVSHSP